MLSTAISKATEYAKQVETQVRGYAEDSGIPGANIIVQRNPDQPEVIIRFDIADTTATQNWGTIPGKINSIVASDDREALFIRTELERQLVVSDVLASFDMSVNGVRVAQEQIVPEGQTDLTSEEDIPF